MENNTEKPLVGWGEIADFLKLSVYSAKKLFKDENISSFKMLRYTSIFPSTLKKQLENRNINA